MSLEDNCIMRIDPSDPQKIIYLCLSASEDTTSRQESSSECLPDKRHGTNLCCLSHAVYVLVIATHTD